MKKTNLVTQVCDLADQVLVESNKRIDESSKLKRQMRDQAWLMSIATAKVYEDIGDVEFGQTLRARASKLKSPA